MGVQLGQASCGLGGGVVHFQGAGPRAFDGQDLGEPCAQCDGVVVEVVGVGVGEGGVEIRILGLQPRASVLRIPQVGSVPGGRPARLRTGVPGDDVRGALGGVGVVAQQLAEGLIALRPGVDGDGLGAGVGADQVMHAVAVGGRLGQQVVVDEALQQPFGPGPVGVEQRGDSVGVDIRSGYQAQAAQQDTLGIVQGLVRQVEHR